MGPRPRPTALVGGGRLGSGFPHAPNAHVPVQIHPPPSSPPSLWPFSPPRRGTVDAVVAATAARPSGAWIGLSLAFPRCCCCWVGGCALDCPAGVPPHQRAAAMDDGDLDFSNPDTYLCPALGTDPPSSCSMDSYFDEILKDTEHHACTHTHTCNPPVHDLSHTHTCVHVHTKIVAAGASPDAADPETAESPSENNTTNGGNNNAAASKKRPSGNRAAVRKYREKKKAHTASLEEEVVHLRALNQQLMKKLQSHAALEAEVARLRCLLVDIRGRIEGEIGAFPYQRPPPAVKNVDLVSSVDQGSFLGGGAVAQVTNACDFRCNDQMYCSPGMQGAIGGQVLGQGPCDVASIQCIGNTKSGSAKLPVCGGLDTVPAVCLPNVEKK